MSRRADVLRKRRNLRRARVGTWRLAETEWRRRILDEERRKRLDWTGWLYAYVRQSFFGVQNPLTVKEICQRFGART